ncbi:MAG: hypothetical protein ACJ74W_21655 [Pyrinomonadaceae bacterium]
MSRKSRSNRLRIACVLGALLCLSLGGGSHAAQEQEKSIGGKEHEDNILGVRIGMDVPTALEAVFRNGQRKPGQEKPDAKKNEGKDNKDVRVLYKGLKVGELSIVFAEGKWVKEIMLIYAGAIPVDTLRLPYSSNIGEALSGLRYDDRYNIGFTSTDKRERYWWRDENTPAGYHVRVGFISGKLTSAGSATYTTVARKIITVTPGDEAAFLKAMGGQ